MWPLGGELDECFQKGGGHKEAKSPSETLSHPRPIFCEKPFLFLETESHYVALADLELTI